MSITLPTVSIEENVTTGVLMTSVAYIFFDNGGGSHPRIGTPIN
jgi:hypothetical protein